MREQLDCFGKRGQWQRLHSPVVLPWPRIPYGGLSHCDREHMGKEGQVAGGEADEEAKKGRRNNVWLVREALKHAWEVEEGECEEEGGGWQKFDQRDFCRLLDKGSKVLIVGDSLNLQFTKSILYNSIINTTGEK